MADTTIRRSDVMTDLAARFNEALDVPANPVAQEAEVAEPAALNTFSTDAFLDAASGRGAYPTSKDGTPLFRQGDPRWGGRILGHNSTISAAGCAMTSMAMAISKISGKVMNPGELDAWLDRHGGYSGDALMWDKAAQARGLHAAKASWSFSTINKQIDAGRPVVIGIDHKPGSNGGANGTDHWIAVTGRGKDSAGRPVYFANDPATGKAITLHVSGNRLIGDRNYKSTGQLVVLTGGKVNPPKPPPPAPHPLKGMTLPAGDLQRGAKGANVKALQEALVKLGCLSKADYATGPGVFGPKTEAALKKFQASHGVPSTGYYGPLTRTAMQKLGAGIGAVHAAAPAAGAGAAAATPPRKGGPTDFRVASFNVLGASHTAPGGNKASRPSGVARMKLAAQVIQQHKLDVIGFQEFEPSQRKAFMHDTKHQFDMYPGAHGGKADPVNSIAWRKDKWDFVKGTHVTVPYFEGHKKQMPVVLLKNKETGQKAWFINVHNPASTKNHPHNEHWRDVATQKEIAIIKQLEKTGLPVIMTGDMNEKQEALRHITRGTDMKAAMNGKNSHSHHVGIDWIFGSPNVHFDGYDRDAGKKVQRASDHPLVYSNVHIPAAHKK